MFWNVTFIYNAFIRTTDHCKVQTAFASRVVKNYTGSLLPGYPGTRNSPTLGHLTNFLRIFTDFFNFGKFVQIREFFCWGNEFSIYGHVFAVQNSSSAVVACLRTGMKLAVKGYLRCSSAHQDCELSPSCTTGRQTAAVSCLSH